MLFPKPLRLTLAAAGLIATMNTARAADLTVTIEGLRNDKGQVLLCLFSNAGSDVAAFPDCTKGKPVRSGKAVINGGKVTLTYNGLADGSYAVAAIHDEDGDGKLGTNFLGIPNEGIGISNNPTLTGQPSFKEARFDLAAKKAITIIAKYFL